MSLISESCIMTQSGRYVEPLNLDANDIDIRDIAYSLAGQYRFTSHTRPRYSVGEHSVRAAMFLEEQGASRELVAEALLHDATEYVLVDIPRPLKADPYFGKAYRGAEDRLYRVIMERFGLPTRMSPEVRDIDVRLLATERRDLLPETPGLEWGVLKGVEPLPDKIVPWNPTKTETKFLNMFYDLFPDERPEETA